MGPAKMKGMQTILKKGQHFMEHGISVPVIIMPEPSNPVGKNAIAFQCFMDNSWSIFV